MVEKEETTTLPEGMKAHIIVMMEEAESIIEIKETIDLPKDTITIEDEALTIILHPLQKVETILEG